MKYRNRRPGTSFRGSEPGLGSSATDDSQPAAKARPSLKNWDNPPPFLVLSLSVSSTSFS